MDAHEFLDVIGPLTENTQLKNTLYDELAELATEHGITPDEFNKTDIEALTEQILTEGTTTDKH